MSRPHAQVWRDHEGVITTRAYLPEPGHTRRTHYYERSYAGLVDKGEAIARARVDQANGEPNACTCSVCREAKADEAHRERAAQVLGLVGAAEREAAE